MAAPQVPIDVDPATGIWRTDGMPMIYLPRHFLVNLQQSIEEAIGIERFREVLYASSERSALQWCRAEARTHGLGPEAVFRHYLKRLSQRGYGRLALSVLDAPAGIAAVTVHHSAFALGYGPEAGRPVCAMFEGSFAGAMRHVLDCAGDARTPLCREVACAANGADHCRFEIRCVG